MRNHGQRDDDAPVPRGGAATHVADELDESDPQHLLDLDAEDESPFLRVQKRVPVRRGPLPRKAADRLKQVLLAILLLGVLAVAALILYRYGTHSWRFRIASSDNIEIAGVRNVARAQVLEVLGGDIGRNIFFVPLEERKRQLEEIPWVESAAVMRLLPDRLRVDVRERTPVAFVRIGSRISLIDAAGVVMELPAARQKKYSFPVITGMGDSEPRSTRAARMKIYATLMRELDSEGAHYSQDLSEVELSDPEDVKVTVPDPAGAVLVHLGASNFLPHYKIYMAHAQEWRQQFQKLESVDLRYDRQIIVNPDSRTTAHAAPAENKPPQAAPPKKKPAAKKPAAHHATAKKPAPAHKPSPQVKTTH